MGHMVHLFSMTRNGKRMAVMARQSSGHYQIESIDGYAAVFFPACYVTIAHNRINGTIPKMPERQLPTLSDPINKFSSAFEEAFMS